MGMSYGKTVSNKNRELSCGIISCKLREKMVGLKKTMVGLEVIGPQRIMGMRNWAYQECDSWCRRRRGVKRWRLVRAYVFYGNVYGTK